METKRLGFRPVSAWVPQRRHAGSLRSAPDAATLDPFRQAVERGLSHNTRSSSSGSRRSASAVDAANQNRAQWQAQQAAAAQQAVSAQQLGRSFTSGQAGRAQASMSAARPHSAAVGQHAYQTAALTPTRPHSSHTRLHPGSDHY